MAENELISGTETLSSVNQEKIAIFESIKSLQSKKPAKEHELEKAYAELSVGEKAEGKIRYFLEQKARTVEKKRFALEILEDSREKDEKKIEDAIEALKGKLESVQKKYDLKKKTLETDTDQAISYFESELSRLNSDKKETPKTRGLIADITAILHEIHKLEEQVYGIACTTSIEQLDSVNQEIRKKKQEVLDKNPYIETGHERTRREMLEQRAQREANPDAYWSSYFGNTTIISDTKNKRPPKVVPK